MVARAIREGWAVPAERRPGIVQNLCDIADGTHPDATVGASVSAAAVLVSMDDADRKGEIHAAKTGAGRKRVVREVRLKVTREIIDQS